MEASILAFSAAKKVLRALHSPEIKDLFSTPSYKLELRENIVSMVTTIKAVMMSADSKQALTQEELAYIDGLKDLVYEVDDLMDELFSVERDNTKDVVSPKERGYTEEVFYEVDNADDEFNAIDNYTKDVVSPKERGTEEVFDEVEDSNKKVSTVFHRLGNLYDTYQKLDVDTHNANKLYFKIDNQPIRKREKTSSDVKVSDIVGRDDDKKEVIKKLLDPNSSQEDVCVVAIVGMGGLGKTVLAQLVYNDPTIVEEFPLRLWACVSDQDQTQFDVKPILANILESSSTFLGQLVQELRKKLDGKKYLLVLDDVWTESRSDWLKLKPYLSGLSQSGNKIIVTTRSRRTAVAIGSSHTYKLQGVSDESSWSLFEKVIGSERANLDNDSMEIGKKIVKKCANVPLAIKEIGSLLYGQERNTWISFKNSTLSEMIKDNNDTMSILKFSYHHLSPSLKSCFTYCALFPKGFVFNKEKLLDFWMAQDYIEPLDEGQNIEDAAEEHFQILEQRCFFQDLENNIYEEEVTFKIHDLMHDMAQQVAGNEIYIENSMTVGKSIRHLYDDSHYSRPHDFIVKANIRTYLMRNKHYNSEYGPANFPYSVSRLLAYWRSLRTLDLHTLNLSGLPDTIDELLHLRYLDLRDNYLLTELPKSLTKLINLQFLDLYGCKNLEELPEDLSKLVNLRTLYLPDTLEYMPVGLARMTRLTRLNCFIVNKRKSSLNLEELKALSNLKGSLEIKIIYDDKHAKEYCGKGEYICHLEHLNSISICWGKYWYDEEVRLGNDEEELEDLQPHRNLTVFSIWRYSGVRIPRWAREDSLTTSLPNLVKIELVSCIGLEELPWLGRLQHLKTLVLEYLPKVEYMENRRSIGEGSSSSSRDDGGVASNSSTILFFPSFETLELYSLPKLKGWWRGKSNSGSEIVNSHSNILTHPLPSFPRLSYVTIRDCPNMASIPLCPAIKTLTFTEINEGFQKELKERYSHAAFL